MARDNRPKSTTIPLALETKTKLEKLKLSDGEESWDHLANRLHKVYRLAEERGLLAGVPA